MKDLDLAYWAGMLDGEGTISITRTYSKTKSGKRTYYFVRTMLYQSKRFVCEDAMKDFGIGFITKYPPKSIYIKGKKGQTYEGSEMYSWSTTTNQSETALKELTPFLRIKRKQAELALSFIEHLKKHDVRGKRNPDGSYQTIPPDELAWREKAWAEMKRLNEA